MEPGQKLTHTYTVTHENIDQDFMIGPNGSSCMEYVKSNVRTSFKEEDLTEIPTNSDTAFGKYLDNIAVLYGLSRTHSKTGHIETDVELRDRIKSEVKGYRDEHTQAEDAFRALSQALYDDVEVGPDLMAELQNTKMIGFNEWLPKSCDHSWKTYDSGWTTYEYCSLCDVKKA
jgi:hypothetical protein